MPKSAPPNPFKGAPPVYYINLDRSVERNQYMLDQFRQWGIKNFTRISGYDGAAMPAGKLLRGRMPDKLTGPEIGCVLSHLKAIRHFFETNGPECALICEDDACFDTARYWNFTWKEVRSHLPYDWDTVQLAIINPWAFVSRLHRRLTTDFSAACYLISRHHAAKLVKAHVVGQKYRLDNGVKPAPLSEHLIYNSGVTYSIPLFCYNVDLASLIHPDHVERVQRTSHALTLEFWKSVGSLQDCKRLFDYAFL